MPEDAIVLKDVWFSYAGTPVLEDVSLAVKEKDFLGIIGPNGGGKTTLLKIILGLVRPDRGEVLVFGAPPASGVGMLGYVPQYAHIDPSFPLSVRDVVLMGRLGKRGMLRRYSIADRAAADEALEMVEIGGLKGRQIGKLSGGQRQRVLIARALASEPKILLLDEPSASLDTNIGKSLYALLDKLSREIAVVLVTHDIGVISQHVRSVACMSRRLFMHSDSNVIDAGTLEKVYGCPVDLIAHGAPHRVFEMHDHGEDGKE